VYMWVVEWGGWGGVVGGGWVYAWFCNCVRACVVDGCVRVCMHACAMSVCIARIGAE